MSFGEQVYSTPAKKVYQERKKDTVSTPWTLGVQILCWHNFEHNAGIICEFLPGMHDAHAQFPRGRVKIAEHIDRGRPGA